MADQTARMDAQTPIKWPGPTSVLSTVCNVFGLIICVLVSHILNVVCIKM